MTQREDHAKLAKVKLAMAEKYENLARLSGSKPQQRVYLNRAGKYRRQAADLTRKAAS